MQTFRIELDRLTFGIDVDEETGKIKDAAPVARWTIGKYWERVCYYYQHRGAKITKLKR